MSETNDDNFFELWEVELGAHNPPPDSLTIDERFPRHTASTSELVYGALKAVGPLAVGALGVTLAYKSVQNRRN